LGKRTVLSGTIFSAAAALDSAATAAAKLIAVKQIAAKQTAAPIVAARNPAFVFHTALTEVTITGGGGRNKRKLQIGGVNGVAAR
jgi:hypothetical protein